MLYYFSARMSNAWNGVCGCYGGCPLGQCSGSTLDAAELAQQIADAREKAAERRAFYSVLGFRSLGLVVPKIS